MQRTSHTSDLYPDAEMQAATGLDSIHVRRLITWGAVSPVMGGKGVVRQWDRDSIRQIACVNALYVAGLSLPLAHTLAILMPANFLIEMIDPRHEMVAATEKWFDRAKPLQAVEKSDLTLMIADGFSIFWKLGIKRPIFIGKLSEQRSVFLSGLDHSRSLPDCDPSSLAWKYQADLDTDSAQAKAREQLEHPVSLTTVNLSLAAKIAMRKLLNIPVRFK